MKYQLVTRDVDEIEAVKAQEALDNPVADALTWREAKKKLRQYYLQKAASLRGVTERTYFKE